MLAFQAFSAGVLFQKTFVGKKRENKHLVGGLVAILYFPINLGLRIIPIDELIYFRGVACHQPDTIPTQHLKPLTLWPMARFNSF